MRPFYFLLMGIILSSASLAQAEPRTDATCGLREPKAPRLHGLGTILGIQDAAMARANIARREAQRGGAIDPHYLGDLRAVVKQDDGIIDTFDIPLGMTVRAGDRVRLQGSYRSTASPCSYIPHMAIPNDAPAA